MNPMGISCNAFVNLFLWTVLRCLDETYSTFMGQWVVFMYHVSIRSFRVTLLVGFIRDLFRGESDSLHFWVIKRSRVEEAGISSKYLHNSYAKKNIKIIHEPLLPKPCIILPTHVTHPKVACSIFFNRHDTADHVAWCHPAARSKLGEPWTLPIASMGLVYLPTSFFHPWPFRV